MARVLIVGCGCRGLSLARALPEHAVRGTSRNPDRVAELETAGVEGVVADPDRLGTLVRALDGVAVVCWLMGSAADAPAVHGDRLQSFLEHLVDTPVRGFVYEAAGAADPDLLERGAQIVREASRIWRIRSEVVTTDRSRPKEWPREMAAAVARTLTEL